MADKKLLAILRQGFAAWNKWRQDVFPTLRGADLPAGLDFVGADLSGICLASTDLSGSILAKADLRAADLGKARLCTADLNRANLSGANLAFADLHRALLRQANIAGADLTGADLKGADLAGADLSGAILAKADLRGANLETACLSDADLTAADLREANLVGANLSGADLCFTVLIDTDLGYANLNRCRVYGISTWDLKLEGTKQHDLVVTKRNEPEITVDNIEVCQFIYLLLHNEKVRYVIDTITSKVVLILGRFTSERKAVLDALRNELRTRDYLPLLFDFDKSESRNTTETVSLLARMARFIIADITDPSSIPHELMSIVPNLSSVPVQPLLQKGAKEYSMFDDLRAYHWVLPEYVYASSQQLIEGLSVGVICPAEAKVREQRSSRRRKGD